VTLPPTVAPGWAPRDAAWLARAPSEHAGSPARPLFIGACPRSGTTLLRVILDHHPHLAMPHETDFLRPLWWQRHRFGDLTVRANRRRIGEWIFTNPERRGRRLRAGHWTRREAIRRIANAPPTIGSIAQACFLLYAEAHDKLRWGDKRPAYSGFIGMLLEMFPDAQYVNVVRDPRGAVASQLGMGWDAPEVAVAAATARWEAAIRRTDHFARRLRPDQVMDLRYEDLVADPHGTMARVADFAGLRGGEAIDRMLGAERTGFRGVHERVTQPVTTASIERWRERLTPVQVALVESAAAPHLERFGYRPAEDLSAAPAPADVLELARQRRSSALEWRRSQLGELARRAGYRQPVAAWVQ
jgi:hypothetical protein